MVDSSHNHPSPSRLGIKTAVGEIVEVQGGHIVRSTGRKDRHSKVCTAKGPRDRRVRLAAHTAIQFYDVQDRLGYDRPSKAVDWLIKKAKAAIDELTQLPPWHPTTCSTQNPSFNPENDAQKKVEDENQQGQADLVNSNASGRKAMTMAGRGDGEQALHHGSGVDNHHHHNNNNNNSQNSSFLPPSLDSDAIADTIKSFFPVGASDGSNSSAMQFQSQDLRLSLQSFQDPIFRHQNLGANIQGHALSSGTPPGFDGTSGGWPEHHRQHSAELSRFQRLTAWNSTGDTSTGNGSAVASAGYLFNSPPAPQPLLHQLLGGHNQFFSQRGPLQSSNTPSIRAWIDPPTGDHSPQNHNPGVLPIYQSSVSGIGLASGFGGFSGFHIPARIQGDEEEHDGYSDKPSSASSDSHH